MSKAFQLIIANKKAVPESDLAQIRNEVSFLYPGTKILECQPNTIHSVVSRAQQSDGACIALLLNQFLTESELKFEVVNLEKLRIKYIIYPRPSDCCPQAVTSTKQQLLSRISHILAVTPAASHPDAKSRVGVVLLLSPDASFNQTFRQLWQDYGRFEDFTALIDFYEIASLGQFVSAKTHAKWVLLVDAKELDSNVEALKIIEKSERVAVVLYDPERLAEGSEFIPKETIRQPEEIGNVVKKIMQGRARRSSKRASQEQKRNSLTKATVIFNDKRRGSKKQTKIAPPKQVEVIELYVIHSSNPKYQDFYSKLTLPYVLINDLKREFSRNTKSLLIGCYQDRLEIVKMLRVENKGAIAVVLFNVEDEITQYVNHPCVDLSTNSLEQLMSYFQNKRIKPSESQRKTQRLSTKDGRSAAKKTTKVQSKLESIPESKAQEPTENKYQYEWVVKRQPDGEFMISRRKYFNDNLMSITKPLSAQHRKQSPMSSPPSSILGQLAQSNEIRTMGSRNSIIMPSQFKAEERLKGPVISNNYNELGGNFKAAWLQQGSIRNAESMSHVNLAASTRIMNMVADVAVQGQAKPTGDNKSRVSLEEHMFPHHLIKQAKENHTKSNFAEESSVLTDKTMSEHGIVQQYLQQLNNKCMDSHISNQQLPKNSGNSKLLSGQSSDNGSSLTVMKENSNLSNVSLISRISNLSSEGSSLNPYSTVAPPVLSVVSPHLPPQRPQGRSSYLEAKGIRSDRRYPTIQEDVNQEDKLSRCVIPENSGIGPSGKSESIRVGGPPVEETGSGVERKPEIDVSELQTVSVIKEKGPQGKGRSFVTKQEPVLSKERREVHSPAESQLKSKIKGGVTAKQPVPQLIPPQIQEIQSVLTTRYPSNFSQPTKLSTSSVTEPLRHSRLSNLPSIMVTQPNNVISELVPPHSLYFPKASNPPPPQQKPQQKPTQHAQSMVEPSSPHQITFRSGMSGYEVRKVGGIEIYSWKSSSNKDNSSVSSSYVHSGVQGVGPISVEIANSNAKSSEPVQIKHSNIQSSYHSNIVQPLSEVSNVPSTKTSKFKPTSISEVVGTAAPAIYRSRPLETYSIKNKEQYESYYTKQPIREQNSNLQYGRLLSGLQNRRPVSAAIIKRTIIQQKINTPPSPSKKLILQHMQRPPSGSLITYVPSRKLKSAGPTVSPHRLHLHSNSQLNKYNPTNPQGQSLQLLFQSSNEYINRQYELFEDYPARMVDFTDQASLQRALKKMQTAKNPGLTFAVVDRLGLEMFSRMPCDIIDGIMYILITGEFDTKPVSFTNTKQIPQSDSKSTFQQITRYIRQSRIRMLQQPILTNEPPVPSQNVLNIYYKESSNLSRIHNSLCKHYPGLFSWVKYASIDSLIAKLASSASRHADLVIMDARMLADAQRIAETPRLTWLVMVVFGKVEGWEVPRSPGLRVAKNDRELFEEIKYMFEKENCL